MKPLTEVTKPVVINTQIAGKPKKKMGRPITTGSVKKTYSITGEPIAMAKFDRMCAEVDRTRASMIQEGMEMVTEKYDV